MKQLGGPDTSAIGWAIGMERLLMLLEDLNDGENIPDVYVVNKGIEAEKVALVLTRKLRASNFIIELDNSQSPFSKQFKRANRSRAKWAIIIGEDEISYGIILLKKLASDHETIQTKEISIKDFP